MLKFEFNINNSKKLRITAKIKINFIINFDHLNAKNLKQLLDYIKIPSGEITNLPLINVVSKMNKKLIISTGMCNLKEVNKQ